MARREDVAESPLPGTGRRLIVSRNYKRSRDHPLAIVSPLQSESTWVLRIVESRKDLTGCELRSRTGEFDGVSAAPDASFAAVRWNDQTEAGLVLVDVRGTPRQIQAEWETRATNWIEGPTWTPDSELLVLVENPSGAGPWWAEREPGEAEDDDVSPGGTFSPGSFVVLDRDLQERFRAQIDVELPGGWFPRGDADRGLGAPMVVASDEAVVNVPTLGDRKFDFTPSRGLARIGARQPCVNELGSRTPSPRCWFRLPALLGQGGPGVLLKGKCQRSCAEAPATQVHCVFTRHGPPPGECN